MALFLIISSGLAMLRGTPVQVKVFRSCLSSQFVWQSHLRIYTLLLAHQYSTLELVFNKSKEDLQQNVLLVMLSFAGSLPRLGYYCSTDMYQ